jgi:hypothetical protein
LNQTSNDCRYFHQLFDRGFLYNVQLFLDFEDWRMGSRGFSWAGAIPPTEIGQTSIPKARGADGRIQGAHFWPYSQTSLGPDIPCYLKERNQGLVLDRSLLLSQIHQQQSLVSDLTGRVEWLGDNIELASMGPELRSRKDVRRNLTWVQDDFHNWLINEELELLELSSSQCINEDCWIQFNTTSLALTGAITGTGVVRKTDQKTEAAVFTFNSIYLGPEVKVTVCGQRPLVLISKTSAVINTTINIPPGTLGGFPGGGSVARLRNDSLSDNPMPIYICDLNNYCSASPYSSAQLTEELITNNVNGPGSGNVRLIPFIIKTGADHVPEIQSITTLAEPGQTLAGGFVLSFGKYSTTIIPHDASAKLVKQVIENNLNIISPDSTVSALRSNPVTNAAGVGIVNVTRSRSDDQEGYTWNITFTTAIGNIEQLKVKSFLFGINAKAFTATVRDGNEIGGNFYLNFQNYITSSIPYDVSADQLKSILLDIPVVTTAFVRRIDPTQNCDDGLCLNGPYPARGLLWSVYITTDSEHNNITPTSPTSPVAFENPVNYLVTVTSEFTGINSKIHIFDGTSESPDSPLLLLNISSFSLAFGGAGGSYGGYGGKGYSDNPVGNTYNTMKLDDLLGGSGGCMGQNNVFQINAALGANSGIGGNGGGAIEIIASNDLTIGNWGKIIVKGQPGQQTSNGGAGGGSGGAILLTSSTVVKVDGLLDVSGGNGGFGGNSDNCGGGGGGGRIALYADSVVTANAVIKKEGGKCGIYQFNQQVSYVSIEFLLYFHSHLKVENERVLYLASEELHFILDSTVNDIQIANLTILDNSQFTNYTLHAKFLFPNESQSFSIPSTASLMSSLLSKSRLLNIGQFILLGAEIQPFSLSSNFTTVVINTLISDDQTGCTNHGEKGTLYIQTLMTTTMYVGKTMGAEGTSNALFFSNRESTITSSGSIKEAPFAANGPVVSFEPSRPERITYYTKTEYVPSESTKSNYGSLFTLVSRGEAGLNISNVIGT